MTETPAHTALVAPKLDKTTWDHPEWASLHAKLAKLRGLAGGYAKVGEAYVKTKTGGYTYDYADINAVLECLDGHWVECGLNLYQPVIDGYQYSIIIDTDTGAMISSHLELNLKLSPQDLGSEITYFRRYTLIDVLGLRSTDDDGKAANEASKRKPAPPKNNATAQKHVKPERNANAARDEGKRLIGLVKADSTPEEFEAVIAGLIDKGLMQSDRKVPANVPDSYPDAVAASIKKAKAAMEQPSPPQESPATTVPEPVDELPQDGAPALVGPRAVAALKAAMTGKKGSGKVRSAFRDRFVENVEELEADLYNEALEFIAEEYEKL